MKQGLIIAALTLVLASGLWAIQQHRTYPPSMPSASQAPAPMSASAAAASKDVPESVVVAHVPADTIFFFGTLGPVALTEYTRMLLMQTRR